MKREWDGQSGTKSLFWQQLNGANGNIGNLKSHIIAYYSQPMQDPNLLEQKLGPFAFGKPLRVPDELKESFKKALADKKINTDDSNLPPVLHQALSDIKDGSRWEPYN